MKAIRRLCLLAGIGVIGFGLTLPTSGSQGRWLACLAGGGLLIAFGAWPRSRDIEELDDRPVINVVAVLSVIFGLLAVQLARMQALSSSKISERSGVDPVSGDVLSNPRLSNRDLFVNRGAIRDRNGEDLARSVKRGDIFVREYPNPDASYVVGFFSPLKYGTSGLEKSYNDSLNGDDSGNEFRNEINELLSRTPTGADLELTLDVDLQQLAQSQLETHIGAIVAIEVATGAVLALASNPHLDPNELITTNQKTADSATAYWAELNADPSQPLLTRATNGLYTPGSTFKTVTVSAAIQTGVAKPTDVYTDNGSLDVDGHIIVEENRPNDTVTEWTLTEGLAYSLNVVFAQVGLELGPERLRDYAERFGFGVDIPFDVPVATGQIASTPGFLESPAALADTAFGQGQLLTTPLGMALVAACLANHGRMMRPYLVANVVDKNGKSISKRSPQLWRTPVDESTADTVRDLMVNNVENGYSITAAIEGFTVGGKTGTAETNTEEPHAWFIGFVGDPDPIYAVAVVLEHGGAGTQGPMIIAREVLSAAMDIR